MLSAIQTAFLGIQRSQRALHVAAQNIANFNTDGYRSRRYNAGADTVEIRNPHAPLESDPIGQFPVNDVDLASEIIEMKTQEHAFKANVTAALLADRTTDTLLDIFAD